MKYGWLALMLVLGGPSGAEGQRLIGSVREDGALAPVIEARVVLIDGTGRSRATALTDTTGRFALMAPANGRYRVEVQHTAFAAYTSTVFEVGPAETVTLEIRMGRGAIPLEPLVVSARTDDPRLAAFHERRLGHGFGRFLTRADVERRGAARPTDLVRGMPGVTIVPVRRGRTAQSGSMIMMRGGTGSCAPAIFVDGLKVEQMAESTIDDVLDTQSIEGVEVYTSSTTAPVEFAQHGGCGVVVFWTRSGTRNAEGRLTWTRLLITGGLVALVAIMAF